MEKLFYVVLSAGDNYKSDISLATKSGDYELPSGN